MIASIRAAARTLEGVAVRTPLLSVEALLGAPVYLKCEQFQPIGAFKIRGAYTALARLDPAVRARGVVTSSSGNHGQAVAWAARAFGVRAVVVMPESAAKVKVDGVRAAGGEVVFAGATRSAEQTERAERFAREEGLALVPPFDHPDVIAGQGTCGLEILEQLPEVETILVPVGGGGLLGGIAAAVAGVKPAVRVVGVEPAGAPKLSAALAAGRPTTLPATASLADGLLTRAVGTLTWELIRPVVREAVQVSELQIQRAVRLLYEEARLAVEPSGAVTVAALLAGHVRPTGPAVAVVSGGNVDADVLARILAAGADAA
ncbi:MAG TPA: threonine/serine dehydratase [Gemmatimonadales bacterium]|nr:threonine/serine dehydratase [Gemmatimonadales bacterium]